MKRKAENADNEIVGFESDALEFFRSEHALKRAEKRGQFDGQLRVVEQPADVFQGVGEALQEMHLAFEKAAIAVGGECLHDADVNEAVVVAQEGFAVEADEGRERVEIVIEKPLAKIGREVGLGVEEKRGDVVLQGAFAAALIVNEIGQAVAQHDVARLKIAIEEIIARGLKEEVGQEVPAKMFGELEEGDVFFTAVVQNADRAHAIVGEADDFSAGAAQFPLQWLNVRRSNVEVPLEKFFENV